jgi:hypothetical protein
MCVFGWSKCMCWSWSFIAWHIGCHDRQWFSPSPYFTTNQNGLYKSSDPMHAAHTSTRSKIHDKTIDLNSEFYCPRGNFLHKCDVSLSVWLGWSALLVQHWQTERSNGRKMSCLYYWTNDTLFSEMSIFLQLHKCKEDWMFQIIITSFNFRVFSGSQWL